MDRLVRRDEQAATTWLYRTGQGRRVWAAVAVRPVRRLGGWMLLWFLTTTGGHVGAGGEGVDCVWAWVDVWVGASAGGWQGCPRFG
eukprot:359990-Chlamydomonas_euryale.AAC.4